MHGLNKLAVAAELKANFIKCRRSITWSPDFCLYSTDDCFVTSSQLSLSWGKQRRIEFVKSIGFVLAIRLLEPSAKRCKISETRTYQVEGLTER